MRDLINLNIEPINKTIFFPLILVLYVNAKVNPFNKNAVEKIFNYQQPALYLFTNVNDASTAAQ